MSIFISHITEDSEIAITLKDWIRSTLLGNHEVFVSSDSQSLPAGTKWLDEITKAITNSKILLILCSPESIHRPWINFEAGCGWAKSIPVIPICYGGLAKSQLPQPIAALQALELNQTFPEKLFIALKTHLDLKQLPRIDHSTMYTEIIEAAKLAKKNNIINQVTGNIPVKIVKDEDEIGADQIRILKSIADLDNGLDSYVSSTQIADATMLNKQRVEFHLEKLYETGLIDARHSRIFPSTYSLKHNGRDVLFRKSLI